MHRLQISLQRGQARFLEERARVEGVSMAEVVRRLIEREADESGAVGEVAGIWEIAGIAEDRGPLLEGLAVSERPELYLTAAATDKRSRRRRS